MSPHSAESHNETPEQSLRFLRMSQVEEKIGLCKRTIWRKIKAESFPSPVPLGDNSVGFVESEIEEWMQTRIAARPKPEGRTDD